ncbi:tetratricopeptide repeat-containing hybrid sensor histidine kinase/response regulator [Aquimarina rhabdastrellae]
MLTQIKYYITFIFALWISVVSSLSYSFGNQDQLLTTKDSIENYLNAASFAIHTSKFELALKNITLAKELSHNTKDRIYSAKTSRVLAKLYLELRDFKQAQELAFRATKILREAQDPLELAQSLNLCGSICTQLNEFDYAQEDLFHAEKLAQQYNAPELESSIQINLGLLYMAQQKPELAIQQFNSALPQINSSKNLYLKSKLYVNKAEALLMLNQIEEAKKINDLAMNMGKKNRFFEIRSKSYYIYSKIYEQQEDFKTSLLFLKSHQKLNDSLFNINKEIVVQEASAKINLSEKNVLLEELTEENFQQQQSLKLNRLTTILSIALITILSLLTLSLYKNNNLRARANELLQNKNTELIIAKENTERASEAKIQFLSTITHELRTPLYAVTGLTHLLLEESPTPNQKEHLNSLKFSGEYLLSLINNILDLNKLEAKKVELDNTSFNLRKRINDVLIALGKSAKDKNNKLHYSFDDNIPSKLIGDPLKISQVLINLIGNSIKFTQNGNIWIKVKLLSHVENKVFLSFEIEDDGVGISEKKQQSIFENFTQGSVQINRKFGGTGLGLSIVKNLLDLMGSTIKLKSAPGKGSTFYFDLNFDVFEAPPKKYIEEIKTIDYNSIANKRILVVEDNKINQLITRKILEKNNIICDVADNGDTAIEKAKNEQFDLILMDIHMPGISGIEATRIIRKFDSKIPIIALTAVTLDDNLNEFYNNGFDDIIPKPYKTEEFFSKLHKALTKKQPIS